MFRHLFILTTFLLLFCASVSGAAPLTNWSPRLSTLTGSNLNDIAAGNGKIVAVGSNQTVLVSTDNGTTWTASTVTALSYEQILSVAFGNGMFVAVSTNHIIASTNGTDWAIVQADTSLQRITFGNGMFVAVGASAGIATSTDGLTWNSTNLTYTSQPFLSVAYGNGIYVAVGGGMVATSTDGVTWSMMPNEYAVAGTLVDVCYGNGKFFIIGQMGDQQAITYDGTTWSHVTVSHPVPNTIEFLNGQFVLSSGNLVYGLAEDGTLTKSPYVTLGSIARMIYANGRYLGVGSSGTVITSDDGVNWSTRYYNMVGNSLNAIKMAAFGNDVFVAISGGNALVSADGASWKGVALGASGPVEGLAFDGASFYALDLLGNIFSSQDGTAWSKIATTGVYNLRGLGYGAGTLVAVGDGGKIVTSTDGRLWFSRQSGVGSSLTGIVYGNGTFIAYGYGIQVTSQDGSTWSRTGSNSFYSVTFGNGQFLATDGGRAYTSTDGSTWILAAPSILNQSVYSVAYDNGLYFATSYTKDMILTSQNGIDWASGYSDNNNTSVYDVVFGKGTFVAFGAAGIVQTGEMHNISATPAVNGVLSCDSSVADGQDAQCAVYALGDYTLASLVDNGVDVTAEVSSGKYTIASVSDDHTLTATFAAPPPVNGVCGTANGGTFTTKPSSALCSVGLASAVSGTGPWTWSCTGNHGGTSASCSAQIKTYTVTASVAGGNGTVTCSSPVNHGSSTTCRVAPVSGWQLGTFSDNGVDKKAAVVNGVYTISNVTANHAIGATFSDATKPTVTILTIPTSSTSATVPVTLAATDNKGVTAYYLGTSSVPPLPTATGWVATKPVSYTFAGVPVGVATAKTLYAFAKDAAGNVSLAKGAATTIKIPDTIKPVISALTVPATSISATIPVGITASDNVAVTGYFLSTTATVPTASAIGWSGAKPVSYTFTGLATGVPTVKTVYAFVKDAANNVSLAKGASTKITLSGDVTKPTISAFSIPVTSVSATVPILTLTAADNVAVTGYFLSTSATTPAAYAPGWVSNKPVSYTFTGLTAGVATTKTLYLFVKDAANNISLGRGATTKITLSADVTKPGITAFTLAASSVTASVPITALTATDNVAVTGYILSTSATTPDPYATGWSSIKPTSYVFTGLTTGAIAVKTVYLFVKDAANNISAPVSASTTILPVSQMFSSSPSSSAVVINGYLQAGSRISFSIKNVSSYTFKLNKVELSNGGVVIGSSSDSSILNGGQLAPGQTVGVTFTLNRAVLDNGIRFAYYLYNPSTLTTFTVYSDYHFNSSSWL